MAAGRAATQRSDICWSYFMPSCTQLQQRALWGVLDSEGILDGDAEKGAGAGRPLDRRGGLQRRRCVCQDHLLKACAAALDSAASQQDDSGDAESICAEYSAIASTSGSAKLGAPVFQHEGVGCRSTSGCCDQPACRTNCRGLANLLQGELHECDAAPNAIWVPLQQNRPTSAADQTSHSYGADAAAPTEPITILSFHSTDCHQSCQGISPGLVVLAGTKQRPGGAAAAAAVLLRVAAHRPCARGRGAVGEGARRPRPIPLQLFRLCAGESDCGVLVGSQVGAR